LRPTEKSSPKKERERSLVEQIIPLLSSCRGNLVRVHDILLEEHPSLPYSTLTYWVRKYALREPRPQRVGEYVFNPGIEMQHDTSPHRLLLSGVPVKAQCASLVLGFSRKVFVQYYPSFTRFEAKIFLQQALSFMQGSCQRCIIDNTSVILAAGAGAYAVVAPEMLFFSRMFGFEFIAHAVNDPNRKGKIERPFHYVETNFLAGRSFRDWQDLNEQALAWCQTVSNQKPKRALGMSPETAYLQEKPALLPLPLVMPPIYQHVQRTGDTQGYINADKNRYSIPEAHIGHIMDVYQYLDTIDIYYQHRFVATHPRLIGQRGQRAIIKGHHQELHKKKRRLAFSEAEQQLTGLDPDLDGYLKALKSHVRGRGGLAFKQLHLLKLSYPFDAFMLAVKSAKQYGLFDLKRLETMIIKYVRHEFFNL
jgi:hypothetical protein